MERELRRPQVDDDLPFTHYISKVPGIDFMAVLRQNLAGTSAIMEGWSIDQWNFRYSAHKWTLKEVMIHIIDFERIFAYRALRIARHDQTPIAGFEQDDYIPYLYAEQRSPESIIEEYEATRKSSLALFKNFSNDVLLYTGTAAGNPLSVLSIGFIIAGHEIHHLEIIKERYL